MRRKHVPGPPDSATGPRRDETDDAGPSDATEPATRGDETNVQLAVDAVADAQSAVPLVPAPEDDCCARLQRRVGYPSRDVARTWLTFLRGLGYVEETDRGFRRTRSDPTADGVRRGLLDGIVGARELADALLAADTRGTDTSNADDTDSADGDTPTTPGGDPADIDRDAAFAAVREAVPRWERTRTDDWETVWRERTDRLLGWFHALGLVEPSDATDRVRATPTLVMLRREQ